uniref:Uncharacterized protein n=1 Tax=Candidatus Desulfatibia profunda TaxID=2841695 RepID=A0A8J6NVS8_9BACT|nr:hypothetical protein [Candidatus Desulfatibia profunda]
MKMEKGPFYRSFEIEVRSIDEKKRSVDLSFSSEIPALPRPWSEIPEILLHGEDNVDLSYLKTTGSVLLNHQPSGPGQPVVIVGKPTNVRLENRRGVATVVFDTDEESDKTFKKVISGSLRGVSVGAQIVRMVEVKAGDTLEGFAGPAYLATKWRPVEISLSPIPIDYSVGVNRSLSDMKTITDTEDKTMTKEEVQAIINESIGKLNIPKAEDIVTAVRAMLTEDAKPKMKIDTAVFVDLLGRAGAVSMELKAKVADMAVDGKTEIEILRAITEATSPPPDTTDKGDIGDGLKKKQTQRATITTFKGVEDKDFFASLSSPGISLS